MRRIHLLLLLPLLLQACSQSSQAILPSSAPTPVAQEPAIPSPVPVSTASSPTPQANFLQSAFDKAKSAAELAQSASSKDDWALVATRWQQAIDNLRKVPQTSADYQRAQTKISEYSQNLATAQRRQSVQNAPEPQMVVRLPTPSPQSGAPVVSQQKSPQQPQQAAEVTASQFVEVEYLDKVVNQGDSGELMWCAEREILASSLFAPRSYQILDVSEYGNMASVRARIESSNRGGSPIIVNWNITLERGETILERTVRQEGNAELARTYNQQFGGWCVALMRES